MTKRNADVQAALATATYCKICLPRQGFFSAFHAKNAVKTLIKKNRRYIKRCNIDLVLK